MEIGQLFATAGTVDITPEYPTSLGGFGGRLGSFRAIHDPLSVSGLLLQQGGDAAVVLSIDTLFVDDSFVHDLIAGLSARGCPLRREQVFVCATHTHFAPVLDTRKPKLGNVDPDYRGNVLARTVRLVEQLLTAPSETVSARCRSTRMAGGVGRRSYRAEYVDDRLNFHVAMAPNARTLIDDLLSVVRFDRGDGTPVAVLWSWACHPVGFPELESVSADFPGFVNRMLAEAFGQSCTPLFLQGFAGDVRPARFESVDTPSRIPLDAPAEFAPFDLTSWTDWCDQLGRQVVVCSQQDDDWTTISPQLAFSLGTFTLGTKEVAVPTSMSMRVLKLGQQLALTFWGSEPVSGYASRLRDRVDETSLIPVGYEGHVFGYLPTDEMVSEGGYEVDGFAPYFDWEGHHSRGVEADAVRLFDHVAESVGVRLRQGRDDAALVIRRGEHDSLLMEINRLQAGVICLESSLREISSLPKELDALRAEFDAQSLAMIDLRSELDAVKSSTIWRFTFPARQAGKWMKKLMG